MGWNLNIRKMIFLNIYLNCCSHFDDKGIVNNKLARIWGRNCTLTYVWKFIWFKFLINCETLIYMAHIAWPLFGDDSTYKGLFEIFSEFHFCPVNHYIFIICALKLDWNLNTFLKEKFCRSLQSIASVSNQAWFTAS